MMSKIKARKGLRKLNKLSYAAIILFLVMSIQWYSDLGEKEMVGYIAILAMIFAIGMVTHAGGGMGSAASDGIDVPGVDV